MKLYYSVVVIFVLYFVALSKCGPAEVLPMYRKLNPPASCPPTLEDMANAIPMPLMSYNATAGKMELRADTCDGKYNAKVQTDISYYRAVPGNSVGKAYFRMGGSLYVCSATVGGPNMIWTAAHCVYGPGFFGTGYSTDWCFVPGYYPGQPSYDGYAGSQYYYPTQWGKGILQGFMEYDFATVFTSKTFNTNVNPPLKMLPGLTYSSTLYESNGYPAAGKFNGQYINVCTSFGCEKDPNQSLKNTIGINCDSTGGSSGGPWLVKSPNGVYGIGSVNSYGYSNRVDVMFGPTIDSDIVLFENDCIANKTGN